MPPICLRGDQEVEVATYPLLISYGKIPMSNIASPVLIKDEIRKNFYVDDAWYE
jgi:hypothetical protein